MHSQTSGDDKQTGVNLSTSDCFILALEKHDNPDGTSGNTCRYLLELEGKLEAMDVEYYLNHNPDVQWLSSLEIRKRTFFSIPAWKSNHSTEKLKVDRYYTDEIIPREILNKEIRPHQSPLFSFDLLHRPKGNSAIVFSWHHVLMDGYGAALFLKGVARNIPTKKELLYSANMTKISTVHPLVAFKAVRFIAKITKKPFSGTGGKIKEVP